METDDAAFDGILEKVGNDGSFQRRFNVIFNVGAIMFASMSYMSIILALNKPPHNCHVPGMERFNISDVDAWRNLTLPKETDNKGVLSFSKCKMYNLTEDHFKVHYSEWSFQEKDEIACVHGYDYDRTYYDRTPITENDWVCDLGQRETNIFMYNRFGELVGTFIFGQLGDTLGRRPVFYFSVLIITAGRLISMFTASYYLVFSIAAVLGSLTANSIFQAPLIIAMEISKSERRGYISMMQCIGWTVGLCILPMVFWATRDWFWALMFTTIPIFLFIFIPQYLIESPRWLAQRGYYGRAMTQLRRIATVNGIRELAFDERTLEKLLSHRKVEKVYGMASLFSGWRMAKNTILCVVCWIVVSITYFTLVLLSSRMDGNPFLNFLWQSAIELPAYKIGQMLSDSIGRRLSNSLAFMLATAISVPILFICRYAEYETITTVLTISIKLCVSINFFAVNLQSIEIYPTCLRQTGLAFAAIASNLFGVLGPYLVYLGTEYDVRIPFLAIGGLSALGAVCALLLPETLHQALPESIEQARKFGKNHRFFSLPKKPKQSTVKLGQELEEGKKLNGVYRDEDQA
ncbi:solute carrier family 22 member 21 [Culex quinquefasciatus]|uniref:solute carrier family 22 member 21 n=1 Tax=Culex quinquefasciatus TaxID=7176 RepID=UPI0018E34342|nr:solute carrier family 22 member 21 [Culex quinquefasciatus]XP_038122926.1 solute carrier family 22 member 21 [Culex quinquefasciatus]